MIDFLNSNLIKCCLVILLFLPYVVAEDNPIILDDRKKIHDSEESINSIIANAVNGQGEISVMDIGKSIGSPVGYGLVGGYFGWLPVSKNPQVYKYTLAHIYTNIDHDSIGRVFIWIRNVDGSPFNNNKIPKKLDAIMVAKGYWGYGDGVNGYRIMEGMKEKIQGNRKYSRLPRWH
jgi:hypothetical protein